MTEPLSYILPDKAVRQLRRGGKKMDRENKRASRRQWYFGALANKIWDDLPSDVKEELRILDYYAECSQWINRDVEFPVVSESGETLRRWADVERHYRSYPNVTQWRDVLSFDHFDKARFIGADPRTSVTSTEALAHAYHNHWTADDMYEALRQKEEENPDLKEYRAKFAKWLGKDIPAVLFHMNGNRAQAEYHVHELERLVREEQQKGENNGNQK